MIDRRMVLAIAGLTLLAAAALSDVARLGEQLPWRQLYNFPAFYCAGSALNQRRSPYTYEPQHGCQHAVSTDGAFRAHRALVIPAPQPPYDFAPFMLLARLPAGTARAIDAVAIFLAIVAAAVALTRVGIPLVLSSLALTLSGAYLEINDGQIVPFALLALVLAGVALAARRDRLAGVAVTLAALEPHLALPAILSTFLFARRSRAGIALTAGLLAGWSVWAVGPGGVVRYVLAVLPAHAASELQYPYQFGAAYLARSAGAGPGLAVALGDAAYLALLVVALWLAPRMSRALQARELLAYVPAACAVTAGPFLHMVDMPFAIPAALAVTTRVTGTLRAIGAASLCVLAIPWIQVWGLKKLYLAAIFVCAGMLVRLGLPPPAVLGTLGAIAALIYAFELHPAAAINAILPAHRYAAGDLAQAAWARFTQASRQRDPWWFAVKVPIWGALTALLIVEFRLLRARGAVNAVARHSRSLAASAPSPESLRGSPRP